ncbi:MAG: prepilin-type N-terminal cleavage/methylation domain-containing protein [Phycisphaerales bacterium]|nr:prepilin-type N-terminal cleavage/methylation domain-containing protein [Phycisphaerales bacterium]
MRMDRQNTRARCHPAPVPTSARAALVRGFTLIELLVVVSIIALLIGILLPSVGAVRRQARITLCTSNMGQHGKGVLSYAVANQDALPNAPISPGGASIDGVYGTRGQVQAYFASRALPLNGFEFPNPGIPTMTSPADFTDVVRADRWDKLQAWNAYWIILSEYMGDGQGAQALTDIFISPSDRETRDSWNQLKLGLRQGSTVPPITRGTWPNLAEAGQQIRVGSYRYAPTAMTDPRLYAHDSSGRPLVANGPAVKWSAGQNDAFRSNVRRNRVSAVDFPSSKALFWLFYAVHDSGGDRAWFEPGVSVPVAAADGSSRSLTPYKDALKFVPDGDPLRAQSAGPMFEYPALKGDDAGRYPGFFMTTVGGIRGRDL